MNKSKTQKGITLIALIITIVVLLILAVVAINAVNNTGIIQYAQNSAEEYAGGRDTENGILQGYIDYLDENNPYKDNQNGGNLGGGDPIPDEWNYAWICTEEIKDGETVSIWQDTVYTSESELPNDYIIIAKFYEKSDEPDIAPVIGGGELPSGKPYRMSIELKDGVTEPKSMGAIYENQRILHGWAQQVMNFTGPGSTLPVICYTTDVTIGDGINNIGETFFWNSIVNNVTLSTDIRTIEEYAFSYSYGILTTITLPENVTKIGAYAFCECSKLTTITIPSSVTEIGAEAFKDTSKLAEINFTGTKAEWNSISTHDVRGTGIAAGVIVHCTDGEITIGS